MSGNAMTRIYNRKKWSRIYAKVGTLPGLHYFILKCDEAKLVNGARVELRIDDGTTKPEFQHIQSVLIDEVRQIGGATLYVVQRF